MSDFKAAMKWFKWAAGAGNQFEIVNNEIERLRAQVEELERNLVGWEATKIAAAANKLHVSTPEQIDAAWQSVRIDEMTGLPAYLKSAKSKKEVLSRLDIFKCKGCGGSGRNAWGSVSTSTCPDCAPWGSRGWRIGSKDD